MNSNSLLSHPLSGEHFLLIHSKCQGTGSGNGMFPLTVCHKKYSATYLKISLFNLTVKAKTLQNIDTHKFSDMSSVSEGFNLKLDLSTDLTPIHSNAF